jgi:hypothetical protein
MGWLVGFIAKSALMQSPVGAFLKAVPAWAWKLLAVLALLAAGYLWHQHAAHKATAAAYAQGQADEAARIAKKALALKAKVDALTGKIAANIKERNDEENRRIAASADALRLRGPGKAICAAGTGLSSASGGSVAAGGTGDAAGPYMPPEDRAAVPWGWLTDRAEEHDLERAEVVAWRTWYQRMVAAWPKSETPR